MKFATAAYGDNVIKSAQIDNERTLDWRAGDLTATRVCEHSTGIPKKELVIFDAKCDGDVQQLRRFVALAIRDTCTTHREVMIDFNGFSRDLFGGEAHGMLLFPSWQNDCGTRLMVRSSS
jgi:hypothetical protein